MYLKSLVLKGFKSFADRSALTLEPGITAIVGPNGSGKSNISDAVLWVLGERNAKHLRGQAMEDVIFAGSSARKATGVAEVSLVLDNSDGTLPVDYNEVAITRRMFRNGESEYLINGSPARRMDVLDILHDTGLGTGTHSIISQGSLDSILQSSPEDRRALIEEAAGVLKHKQRKAKSQRKLEQMDAHLTRVRDVVAEVERQLAPLERKAKRARTYQGLAAELAELNLQLAVDDLRLLQTKWNEVSAQEASFEDALKAGREHIEAAEAQVEALQERIRRESVDAGELSRQYRLASAAAERFDSTVLLMHERKRSAQRRATELELSLQSYSQALAKAQEDLWAAEEQLAEITESKQQADTLLQEASTVQAQLSEEQVLAEKKALSLNREVRAAEVQLEVLRKQQSENQETLSQSLAHAKLIEGHSKELDLQFERASEEAKTLQEKAAAQSLQLSELEAREAQARTAMGEIFRMREEAHAALEAAQEAERVLASKIKTLQEFERAAAEASSPALSWLLEESGIQDSLKPLSQVVSAPAEYEQLVEQLLGADVAALLVEDAAQAREVFNALEASSKRGEVQLLLRKDASLKVFRTELATHTASQTALVKLLSYPEEFERAVLALLGDVVVCDSLESALAAHENDQVGCRFVTAEGCIVWPSGKLSIGSSVQPDKEGVLARVRHIEDLQKQLLQAQAKRKEAEQASSQADENLRSAQAESLALSQELAQLRGQSQAAKAEAQRAMDAVAALRRELEEVSQQRAAAEAAIAVARPNAEELASKISELEAKLTETKEDLAQTQEASAPLQHKVQEATERLAEAKLRVATLTERHTYAERLRDSRVAEIAQLEANSASASDALARKRRSALRIEPLLAVFDELTSSARCWTRKLEEQSSEAQSASSGLHDVLNKARSEARAAHDAFDAANEKMGAARVEKGRLEIQVEAAINVIVKDCHTPLETVLTLPALENRNEAEEAAGKLRRRIANMGTINPDAAEEYEALKTRYDYLSSQLGDLDSARRSLAKINRVIDARMKEDFIRTYEEVDNNFREIFSILFPGGSAELSLVDPDDLENTGVEVSAQPRGKRITKMMLMSGGEKSLTALALLFAVYRIRTTPFYILDEVEAALDDTNLRRLISYIESLRTSTQLIMITHQRRTMEMADVLFGVSMQADGVTKVISQRLDQALRHAE